MELALSPDAVKDQTYFLAHLTQQQLARVLFPLGSFTKVLSDCMHSLPAVLHHDCPPSSRSGSARCLQAPICSYAVCPHAYIYRSISS